MVMESENTYAKLMWISPEYQTESQSPWISKMVLMVKPLRSFYFPFPVLEHS